MVAIGGPEYSSLVTKELDRLTEKLYLLHHGCIDYVQWHREKNPAACDILAQFPVAIEAAVGVLPLPAVTTLVDLYYKLHQALYQSWPAAGKAV